VQSLSATKHRRGGELQGSNSAPAWTRRQAARGRAPPRTGVPELPDERRRHELEAHHILRGIDTEPFFTPMVNPSTSPPTGGAAPDLPDAVSAGGVRISFEGDYNVSPRVSPDGKTLAYISRVAAFQLMAMDLESKQIQTLTDGQRDESRASRRTGGFILYASDVDNRGVSPRCRATAASSSGSASRRRCARAVLGQFLAIEQRPATGRSLRPRIQGARGGSLIVGTKKRFS